MAVSIKFPNRPCPKCGKPIHIKKQEHDCGWKAEATVPKPKPQSAPAKKAGANETISKMEAVRRVLAESGHETMPLQIQTQLKKKFKIDMDPTVISTYKSSILRKGTVKKAAKPGRPAAAAKTSHGGNISFEDIRAVKALADRIGVEKLRQLAEVLA